MKSLIPALFACALLSTSAQAQPDPVADARAVLASVAADSIRGYRTAGAPLRCVLPTLSGSAFDEYRRMRQEARADPRRRTTFELMEHPGFEWRRAVDYSGGSPHPLLEDEISHLLNEAAGAAIRGEPAARLIDRLESGWLDGIPVCGADPQPRYLRFKAPVISGDLAFVETGYSCGDGCGVGHLYALQRGTGGRWAILGAIWTWAI